MSVHLINPTAARDIKPGDKVDCFGKFYNVRYVNYHGLNVTLRMHPHDEPLYKNNRIIVTIPGDLMIDVEVI